MLNIFINYKQHLKGNNSGVTKIHPKYYSYEPQKLNAAEMFA